MKDVIIIGAGPAGSTTAKVIADAGFNIQLIEKRKPLETKVCGGGISEDLADMLSLPADVIEKRVLYEIHHFPWGRKILSNRHVTVHREIFDNVLANRAKKSGAEVIYETKVIDIKREREKILVYTETKNKEVSCIPCRIVVFADGVGTLAWKFVPSLGFRIDPDHTALGATYEVESKKNTMNHYELYYGSQISSWGYGWIFPKRDSLNIGVGCLLSDLRKWRRNITNSLYGFLRNNVCNPSRFKRGKMGKLGAAQIPLAPARRIYSQSCLVVGDAAGMVDPLLGCGIVHAVSAGKLAGQIAVGALVRRDFSEKYMSRYQTLWRQSVNYRQMRRNALITKMLHPFSAIDKNMISKIEYALFFGRKSSIVENLQSLTFPLFH